jgi:hypothetical protein
LPADFYENYIKNIEAVTAEDVMRVMNKYVLADNLRIIVTGKGSEVIPALEKLKIPMNTLEERVSHIIKTAFNGRRIVVFSGGNAKGEEDIYNEIRQIYKGGANGSIIGRNTFQRPREEALKMLDNIIKIYQGK